jgi:prephenate dehydratase
VPLKIAIQGARGSACEMAVAHLLPPADADASIELVYAVTAKAATEALMNESVTFALLVLESPIGTAVPETVDAVSTLSAYHVVASCSVPVDHVLLGRRSMRPSELTRIVSHSVPLAKHASYLKTRFPNAELVQVDDTGVAACALAEGEYGETAAVVALPAAGTIFGLTVVCRDLPANQGYLTKFALVSLGLRAT